VVESSALTSRATLDAGYFDAMYQAADDPWGFESRWYEQRKYAISEAMLPARRYRHGFEAGCSIGVLTRKLAQRCERLLSCDLSPAAVVTARRRVADLPGVRVEQRSIPAQWPHGSFDLIVFSELLYYFSDRDLARVLDLAVASLRPGGTLLAVHWRHPVAEYPQSGDAVHQALAGQPGLAQLAGHTEPDFLAGVHIRTDTTPVSVAQATGLL
jgi:SAM-dependent methyltransferase